MPVLIDMSKPRLQRSAKRHSTMEDVARFAGVSLMTVSRVVNANIAVGENTRRLVEDAICKLSYSPNTAARQLAKAKPARVGFMYDEQDEGRVLELLSSVLDHACACGVPVLSSKCKPNTEEHEANKMILRGVTGVILAASSCNVQTVFRTLNDADIRSVGILINAGTSVVPTIGIDDRLASCTMVEHILGLGHRRIGFMGSNASPQDSLRLSGYLDALLRFGVPPEPDLIREGSATYRLGLDTAEALLDLANPPTAIFAATDEIAAAAIMVAQGRGLAVPSDLTVCGFGDSAISRAVWPPLTTIQLPLADMAAEAIAVLIDGPVSSKRTTGEPTRKFEFELVRRHSDAVPRRRPRAL